MAKRPRTAPRRRQRGFTLIEVMMALTILTIGILGIISMQKSAVVTNNDAQQFTVATQLARTWLDRLNRDATKWNHPSVQQSTSDLADDTLWLKAVDDGALNYPKWFIPAGVNWLTTGLSESPAFDRSGNDVPYTDSAALIANTVYCTNVRLRWIYPSQLIRAEVRVYWRKRNVSAGYGTVIGNFAGQMCPAASSSSAVSAALGQDSTDFRWVYAVTSIARQGPK
jgi:prepilin-type N-terminal cleavage/methylation domain-containing protein